MQDREFNKLMDGDDFAKAMQVSSSDQLDRLQLLLENHKRTGDREPLIEAKGIVKENETVIPIESSSEIHRFINQKRMEKITERAIRRMVKRKFGIIVLPK